MSPHAQTGWSFRSTPVTSPNAEGLAADNARAELWHARMALLNPATGLPDPSLRGLTVRALYTRDWDVYHTSQPYGVYSGNQPEPGPYKDDPVHNADLTAPNRESLVLQSGNMAPNKCGPNGSNFNFPPLNVNRLLLSAAGGTLDAWADWSNVPNLGASIPTPLLYWRENTVLGRDEFLQTSNAVTVHPGGFPAILTTTSKRCDNPNQGVVGVIYTSTVLTITTPLVSFLSLSNKDEYRTFPFVALEICEAKIPTSLTPGVTDWLKDPNDKIVTVGMIGTDWKGNAIKFTTQLLVTPASANATSTALSKWNGTGGSGPFYPMNGQRIAFAPPADGAGASTSGYSTDSTSFETTGFNLVLQNPKGASSSTLPWQLVPTIRNIAIAVEAIRHLQSSPTAGTPAATATYEYDHVKYAPNGFNTKLNPNEIFLTLSTGGTGGGPAIDFTKNPAQSGGLAAPALGASALSRSRGILSGTVAAGGGVNSTPQFPPGVDSSKGSIYDGGLNAADFFHGFNPTLFGFVPLTGIIQSLEGAASQFLPKTVTKSLSTAEAFLEKAMALYDLLSDLTTAPDSSAGAGRLLSSILSQIDMDIKAFGSLADGIVPAGGVTAGGLKINPGAPLTNAQLRAAAWQQSAAAQAQQMIQGLIQDPDVGLIAIFKDASKVYTDITELHFGELVKPAGKGDLQIFVAAVKGFLDLVHSLTAGDDGKAQGPQTGAGALMKYFGPVAKQIEGALKSVSAFLDEASGVLGQLMSDLALLSQGLDLAKSMSVEFTWKPIITGLKALDFVAFIPASNQGFSIDMQINAHAHDGKPAGANVTIRLDSFAIAFGGILPDAIGPSVGGGAAVPIACGYHQSLTNADVALVFDHMQVQMLSGQKPDVDVVFDNLYFGGDLAFIESIKNLIPLDAFSDPPFVNVDTSGITAGFNMGLPNIAIGMFSMQNLNI